MQLCQSLMAIGACVAADGTRTYGLAVGLLGSATALLLAILLGRTRRQLWAQQMKHQRLVRLLAAQKPGLPLEERLLQLMQPLRDLLPAKYYGCYLFNPENATYRLRALSQQHQPTPTAEVGYGRITSYQRDDWLPPLELSWTRFPDQVTVDPSGEIQLLVMPIAEGVGAIALGMIDQCSARLLSELNQLSLQIRPLLQLALAEVQRSPEPWPATSLAQGTPTAAADSNTGTPIEAHLGMIIRFLRAEGGLLLANHGQQSHLLACRGLDPLVEQHLRHDLPTQAAILDLASADQIRRLGHLTPDYGLLPPAVALLADEFILVRLPAGERPATVLIWGSHPLAVEAAQQTTLHTLAQRMAEVVGAETNLLASSPLYLNGLRKQINQLEKTLPTAVGHSELVARYALAIAKEMHLGESECLEIALAGALHDAGMLSLPRSLWSKAERYTETEYSAMIDHAEIGAEMLSTALANQQASRAIKHHHERWDGGGYPAGLQGEQIPLGARIIAVAEVFVAKLSGRPYREPLPFEHALAGLRAAAGSQLDQLVVEALIRWYEQKQVAMKNQRKSLAPCHVMRCCPPEICTSCPAYQLDDRNCWEVPGVNCQAHGNNCGSCLVQTEYLLRGAPTP